MTEQETRDAAAKRWHTEEPIKQLQRALHECAELERRAFEAHQRARMDPHSRIAVAVEAINERLGMGLDGPRPPGSELSLSAGVLRSVASEQGKGDPEHVALAAVLDRCAIWLDQLALRS